MNIVIHKEKHPIYITGGGYATSTLDIFVDPDMPVELQREVVIHEVIENFNLSWPHDIVEEFTDCIMEALEKLDET